MKWGPIIIAENACISETTFSSPVTCRICSSDRNSVVVGHLLCVVTGELHLPLVSQWLTLMALCLYISTQDGGIPPNCPCVGENTVDYQQFYLVD